MERCPDCMQECIPIGTDPCPACGYSQWASNDEPDYREWDWADANGGGW